MELKQEQDIHHSLILRVITGLIEWGNDWLTLSRWIFWNEKNIFLKIEILMVTIVIFCFSFLFWVDRLPFPTAVVIATLLVQRVVEFVIVYSRNFILCRGRVFSFFKDDETRGQWLLFMFSLNIAQLLFIFAAWYRLLTVINPANFSRPLSTLDSLYFSVTTFFTVGFGDIVPLTTLPKILVMSQNLLTFFIVVVVINGIVAAHFRK